MVLLEIRIFLDKEMLFILGRVFYPESIDEIEDNIVVAECVAIIFSYD